MGPLGLLAVESGYRSFNCLIKIFRYVSFSFSSNGNIQKLYLTAEISWQRKSKDWIQRSPSRDVTPQMFVVYLLFTFISLNVTRSVHQSTRKNKGKINFNDVDVALIDEAVTHSTSSPVSVGGKISLIVSQMRINKPHTLSKMILEKISEKNKQQDYTAGKLAFTYCLL